MSYRENPIIENVGMRWYQHFLRHFGKFAGVGAGFGSVYAICILIAFWYRACTAPRGNPEVTARHYMQMIYNEQNPRVVCHVESTMPDVIICSAVVGQRIVKLKCDYPTDPVPGCELNE